MSNNVDYWLWTSPSQAADFCNDSAIAFQYFTITSAFFNQKDLTRGRTEHFNTKKRRKYLPLLIIYRLKSRSAFQLTVSSQPEERRNWFCQFHFHFKRKGTFSSCDLELLPTTLIYELDLEPSCQKFTWEVISFESCRRTHRHTQTTEYSRRPLK